MIGYNIPPTVDSFGYWENFALTEVTFMLSSFPFLHMSLHTDTHTHTYAPRSLARIQRYFDKFNENGDEKRVCSRVSVCVCVCDCVVGRMYCSVVYNVPQACSRHITTRRNPRRRKKTKRNNRIWKTFSYPSGGRESESNIWASLYNGMVHAIWYIVVQGVWLRIHTRATYIVVRRLDSWSGQRQKTTKLSIHVQRTHRRNRNNTI